MLIYIIRRVLAIFPVLFFASIITFGVARATPGGPWDVASPKPMPQAVRKALIEKYGGNKSIPEAYVDYISGIILRGDFGISMTQAGRPITRIISEGLPISAALGFAAILVALLIGIPIGMLAALRHNSIFDNLAMFIVTMGISVPSFVTSLATIVIFAVLLQLIPYQFQRDQPTSWIAPIFLLSLGPTALVLRLTRSSTLEILSEDYIRTARAKGLRANYINLRHILRNALMPVVTLVGIVLANLVTGTFVVESVFGIPGLGGIGVTSITKRDYTVIMGITLLYTFIIATANLIVDLTYAFIDPRIARP
jgi:oligopeptide transport system permease protein